VYKCLRSSDLRLARGSLGSFRLNGPHKSALTQGGSPVYTPTGLCKCCNAKRLGLVGAVEIELRSQLRGIANRTHGGAGLFQLELFGASDYCGLVPNVSVDGSHERFVMLDDRRYRLVPLGCLLQRQRTVLLRLWNPRESSRSTPHTNILFYLHSFTTSLPCPRWFELPKSA
jgi:hypothetical protein